MVKFTADGCHRILDYKHNIRNISVIAHATWYHQHPFAFAFGYRPLMCLCETRSKPAPIRVRDRIVVDVMVNDKCLVDQIVDRCSNLGTLELSGLGVSGKPSVFLQNLIIRRLCDRGLHEQVLSSYRKFIEDGFVSNAYTFPFVLKSCSALCDISSGKEVHCVVLRSGYERSSVLQTALVDFYGKIGQPGVACKVLDGMSQSKVISWNALIFGYSLNGLDNEAFDCLHKIWEYGLRPNASTLATIIPICCRSGCVDLGISLHGYAIKSGILIDEMLIPALISMYSRIDDIYSARCLFDSLPIKNVVAWNAMIYVYTANSEPAEAYELFKQMLYAAVPCDSTSFISVIPCCEELMRGIYPGECLHVCAFKHGFGNHVSVATSLISMYSKLGKVEAAEILFASVHNKNVLAWNSMVSGYTHNGMWGFALKTVREMQSEGVYLNSFSLLGALSACSKLEAMCLGKSAHAFIIRRGFDARLEVSNALLTFYSECCLLSSSMKIFGMMGLRDSVSWNTLLSGCVHNEETYKVVELFWQMRQEAVEMDLVTLISILPCLKHTNDLWTGFSIHGCAVKRGYAVDVSLNNALVSMYSRCGDLKAASLLFDTMLLKDLVSWNSLITGYRLWNMSVEALALSRQMWEHGLKPDYVTMLNALPCCFSVLQGKSIHAYAVRAGLMQETPLITSLISMYAQARDIFSGFKLFERGDMFSIFLWNTMISACIQTCNAQKAVHLFYELLTAELKPDYVTMLELISACGQIKCIHLTNSVLVYIAKIGFNETIITNALIDVYSKLGDISRARLLFDHQQDKNEVTWTAMINGYGVHGDGEAAFDLFLRMSSRLKPCSITYLSVLSACSHSGLVEQSKIAFDRMLVDGTPHDVKHFACILDLLGRTGNLTDAYNIVKKMLSLYELPSVTSILESLLGACGLHGNVEIGEKIGDLLLQMDTSSSAAYVMLHNVYAGAGRWTEANILRSRMEEKRVRKVAGFTRL